MAFAVWQAVRNRHSATLSRCHLLDFFYQQQHVNDSFRRLDTFVSDIATCPLNGLVHRVAR